MKVTLKCSHCGCEMTANLEPGSHIYVFVCEICERDTQVSVLFCAPEQAQPGPTEFKNE